MSGTLTSMGSALGLKPSVAKAEEEAADKAEKVLGRAVWRREHMSRQPEADQTASPLRRHPTCNDTHSIACIPQMTADDASNTMSVEHALQRRHVTVSGGNR